MSTRVIAPPLLKRLWTFYCSQLAERPVLSRALTSTVGFATGDAIAQSLTSENFDWHRNLKFAVFGFCIHGPLGHTFYKNIDKFVYPAQRLHKKTVFLKTLIDQSMWSPTLLFMFFTFQHTWDRKLNQLETVLKKDFLPTWSNLSVDLIDLVDKELCL